MKSYWIVHHENGGVMYVIAEDEAGAIEAYWESLTSILGHHLGICRCHGDPKTIDRSKFAQPTIVKKWKPE